MAEALRNQDGRRLHASFEESEGFVLTVEDKPYKVTREMVKLKEEMPDNYAAGSFDEGRVYVDLTIPKDLAREGFVREVIRRLQEMRKRLDLPVDAFVTAFISTRDPQKLDWLEDEKETLMEEARAHSISMLRTDQPPPSAHLVEDWKIENEQFRIGISRVGT